MALDELLGARLKLVPASQDHVDHFAELNSDPTVMEHVSGGPSSQAETETEWQRRLGARSAVHRGLGYWVGYLDSQFVGWWGLGYQQSQIDVGELGFRIQARYWRRGLGTEGARLVVEYGFTKSGLSRIWAGTTTPNVASQALLSRLGLRCVDEPVPGVLTFAITRAEWLAMDR